MDEETQMLLASVLANICKQTENSILQTLISRLMFLGLFTWLMPDMTEWQSWIVTALVVFTSIATVSTLWKSYQFTKAIEKIERL